MRCIYANSKNYGAADIQSARKKIAIALVNGLSIKIEGGDYILCDGKESHCNCGGCRKHRLKLKKEIQ